MRFGNTTNNIQAWVKAQIKAYTKKVITAEGNIILPPGGPLGDGYPARPHASTHAFPGGTDPLDPASIGAALATDLSAHISNTSNPHAVTAAQVGNAVAQWNADKLLGRDIDTTAPTNGQVYAWASDAAKWVATTISSGVGTFAPLAGLFTFLGRVDFGTFAAPLSTVAGVFYGVAKGIQAQAVSTDPAATGVVGQGITGVVGQADNGAGGTVGQVGVGVQGYGATGVEGVGYGVGGAGIKGVGQAGSLAARFSGGAVRIDLPVGIKLEVYADGGSTPVATIDEDGVVMAKQFNVDGDAVTVTMGDTEDQATFVVQNSDGSQRTRLRMDPANKRMIMDVWDPTLNSGAGGYIGDTSEPGTDSGSGTFRAGYGQFADFISTSGIAGGGVQWAFGSFTDVPSGSADVGVEVAIEGLVYALPLWYKREAP